MEYRIINHPPGFPIQINSRTCNMPPPIFSITVGICLFSIRDLQSPPAQFASMAGNMHSSAHRNKQQANRPCIPKIPPMPHPTWINTTLHPKWIPEAAHYPSIIILSGWYSIPLRPSIRCKRDVFQQHSSRQGRSI